MPAHPCPSLPQCRPWHCTCTTQGLRKHAGTLFIQFANFVFNESQHIRHPKAVVWSLQGNRHRCSAWVGGIMRPRLGLWPYRGVCKKANRVHRGEGPSLYRHQEKVQRGGVWSPAGTACSGAWGWWIDPVVIYGFLVCGGVLVRVVDAVPERAV